MAWSGLKDLMQGGKDGVKNTLDSFKEDAETVKNKAVDQITSKISSTMQNMGKQLKLKVDISAMLSKFNSLGNILDKLPFGIGSKLNSLLTGFINSQISTLKRAASETAKSAYKAMKHMVTASINRLVDTVMSHLSMSDEMYLAGIKPLYKMGSNISYKNNYARNLAIKMDYSKTLEWIDGKIGIVYGIIDSKPKSNATQLLSTVSGKSCIKIFKYVFDKLKSENKIVVSNIKNYEAQIRTQENLIKASNSNIEIYNEEYTKEETTEIRRGELEVIIELERLQIKEYEKVKSELKNDKKVWDNYDYQYRKLLAQQFKKLLTYSVGNFNTDTVREYVDRFEIKPAWFGDYDPDFNGAFKFTKTDVDVMAPFYTGKGFNRNIKEELGDTRLVQTSKIPKYITLKNIYMKYIYILLNSVNIYGLDNQLSSQVLYERLCYNTMDFLTQLADEALGTMIEDGLGRLGIDVLLAIESAIYDYSVTFEDLMKTPTQKKYVQLQSYTQEMPVPLIPFEETEPDYSIIDPTKNKLTANELKNILQYYLKQLSKSDKYLPLFELYKLFKSYYDRNDDNSIFYGNFIVTYFSLSGLEADFDAMEYFGNLETNVIINTYITSLDNIYYKHYQDMFEVPEDSEILNECNTIFQTNYLYLKELAIDRMVNNMTNAEVYSNLLLIYTTLGEYATKTTIKRDETVELLKFLRKHYTENAYTINFYIQVYLNGLDDITRRKRLKDILKDLDNELLNNEVFKTLKETLFNKLLLSIYPSYSLIVQIENASDIDINDQETIKQVEDNYKDYFLTQAYYRDFDNKVWQILTESLGEDLEKSFDTFQPPEYLNYVVFYNTDNEEVEETETV